MNMGEKIYSLRTQKGMTLEELGNKVGVGKSTVRKWENGTIANMRRDKIAKLAKALETTPAYLMGWSNEADEIPINTFDIAPHEKRLVIQYRQADDLHKAMVDEILNINDNDNVEKDTLKQA